MADLRQLLTSLGYRQVSTLLNSGNAVFFAPKGPSSKHADAIAQALANEFRFEVPVVVKSVEELRMIVEGNPPASTVRDHARLLAVFAQTSSELTGLATIAELVVPAEKFILGNHAAYLYCPNGSLQSKAGAALLGKVGKKVTTRNWATVLKLQALAKKSDA